MPPPDAVGANWSPGGRYITHIAPERVLRRGLSTPADTAERGGRRAARLVRAGVRYSGQTLPESRLRMRMIDISIRRGGLPSRSNPQADDIISGRDNKAPTCGGPGVTSLPDRSVLPSHHRSQSAAETEQTLALSDRRGPRRLGRGPLAQTFVSSLREGDDYASAAENLNVHDEVITG